MFEGHYFIEKKLNEFLKEALWRKRNSIRLLTEPGVLTTQTHLTDSSIFSHCHFMRHYTWEDKEIKRHFKNYNIEQWTSRFKNSPTGSHPTPTITTRRPILKELATLLWVRASGLPWRVWRLKGEESVQRPCLPGLFTNFLHGPGVQIQGVLKVGGGHHQPLKKPDWEVAKWNLGIF